jgi:zinc protease
VSGIAHFLEHLMFKSTEKIASGEFSKTISRLGGQDNAFTTHDYTATSSASPRTVSRR